MFTSNTAGHNGFAHADVCFAMQPEAGKRLPAPQAGFRGSPAPEAGYRGTPAPQVGWFHPRPPVAV
jgi:hypothetical protein